MEDIVAIIATFSTIIIVSLGFPLVRSYVRQKEKQPSRDLVNLDGRLGEMNRTLEAMSIEIERITENQRFLTKLLAEREQAKAALPSERN